MNNNNNYNYNNPASKIEQLIDPHHTESLPLTFDEDDAFLDFFRDDDEDDVSLASSDGDIHLPASNGDIHHPASNGVIAATRNPNSSNFALISTNKRTIRHSPVYISPEPHLSSQFYTFKRESHALMIRCLTEGRLATAEEIRLATPPAVLAGWRSVWKDRSEDTAYVTAWKRIQDKLTVLESSGGDAANIGNSRHLLCFKNNTNQFVSHVDQWQEIIMSFHGDGDFNKHLGAKDTIDRIKQVWTVGAKLYGIPESFIRTCVAACPVCSDEAFAGAPRCQRRRFEYTESFEVPAKEVPVKLQQLAVQHKVVLCIRQKYIRFNPFMAEVKDYACHRAGKPTSSKKTRVMKREPYASKRCGCSFRIRAIVPISNYNEKDKTFVYEEEGTAVFKLYAVHSGHVPGASDGNARIMHRVVGHKGEVLTDQEIVYEMAEEGENESFGFSGKDSGDLQHSILQQVEELRNELGLFEGRIGNIPRHLLGSVSRELFDIVNRLRNVSDDGSKSVGLSSERQHLDDLLVVEHDLPDWGDDNLIGIYGDGKDAGVIEDDEDSFERTLVELDSWEQMRTQSRNDTGLLDETCKEQKWLKCGDEKEIIGCSSPKLTKALRPEAVVPVVGLADVQVDGFFPENPKLFDPPCGLDPGADSGAGGSQHREIV